MRRDPPTHPWLSYWMSFPMSPMSLWQRPSTRLIRTLLVIGVLALGALVVTPHAAFAGSASAAASQPFTITSPNFTDGSRLATRFAFNQLGCPGRNIAPVLNWQGVPKGTEGFAFALNDYDAPVAGGFHHWIVYNIPARARTLSGSSPFSQGMNSYGFTGYGGPCPPATGQIHHYVFTLYALTTSHISGKGLTYDQLMAAINNHVAGATVIIGTFSIG